MLTVFVRETKHEDIELLKRLLEYGKIDEYRIHDLSANDVPKNSQIDIALVVGTIAKRRVQGYVKNIFELASFSNLYNKPGNEKYRAEATQLIQNLKKCLDNKGNEEIVNDIYFLLTLENNKKLCVYRNNKPTIQAYSFISFQEYQALVQIKELTGATSITFGKENIGVSLTPDNTESSIKTSSP